MSTNPRIAARARAVQAPDKKDQSPIKGSMPHNGQGGPIPVSERPTIVVIDKRVLIRDCLASCLRTNSGNCVVLTFASVAEWQAVALDHPSAAVVIVCTQRRDDSEADRDLSLLWQQDAKIPVVLVSEAEDVDHILAALNSGVRGYIPTSVTLDVAVKALRLVEAGGTFVPASSFISSRCKDERAAEQKRAQNGAFTARQTAVLQALRQGKANKRIAYELNMREGTVKVHVRNIMKKLNARNRTEVAILASNLREDER